MKSQDAAVETSRPPRAMLVGILVAAFFVQTLVRQRIDRGRQTSSETAKVLYISSGNTLRRFSLGFDGLLADIYWTRAVQYYGRERLSQHPEYALLGPLLRITTTLDPHLLIAYRFGAIFLAARPPRGPGEPDQAMQLLRRGIVANPGYWRFWQDLGFIQYWDLHNYAAAARTFLAGSERPGAEIWMKTLAAAVAAKGGDIRTSQALWSEIYRSAGNTAIRESALKHLVALKANDDIEALEKLLAVYDKKEGREPASLQDLVATGLLSALPRDPTGVPYQLEAGSKVTLGRGSTVDLGLLQ
jgi:hypothetical protein